MFYESVEESPISLLSNKIRYKGDLEYASKIEKDTKILINKNIDLYEAEEIIKNKIIDKNGLDYYIKETVNIVSCIKPVYNYKAKDDINYVKNKEYIDLSL